MERKEAENIVRGYLLRQKPSSHRIGQKLIESTFFSSPQPDEFFDFPGGYVVVHYESDYPSMSVQKYWWLLRRTDYLQEGKKLALVIIILSHIAQPADSVAQEKALAKELEDDFPGRFRLSLIGADEASTETISTALSEAYDMVKS